MKKLTALALVSIFLMGMVTGCAEKEEIPTSITAVKGSEPAETISTTLSASLAIYVSDTYLSEIGMTADELFGDYAANIQHEVYDETGFSGIELLAGYNDADGMAGIFDLSSTQLSTIMDFSVTKNDAGEVEVLGEFSAVLPSDAVHIYLDMEFPTNILDYGGIAIQGSMLSEGVEASFDINGDGEFHIRGN